MEFFFKLLLDFIRNLTPYEIVLSIILLIIVAFFASRGTMYFMKYRQKQVDDKIIQDAEIHNVTLKMDRIEKLINTLNNMQMEEIEFVKRILNNTDSDISAILDKITQLKIEFQTKLDKNDVHHETIESKLNDLQNDSSNLIQVIRDESHNNKADHAELIRQLQLVIKDLATLHGMLIVNSTTMGRIGIKIRNDDIE